MGVPLFGREHVDTYRETDGEEGHDWHFNEVDTGNHFAAWQEPELFTTEVRAAFRSLR